MSGEDLPTPTTIAARRRTSGELHARTLHQGDELEPGEHYAVTHFATCPSAGQHRKRGQA